MVGGQFNATDFEIVMPFYGDILSELSSKKTRGKVTVANQDTALNDFLKENLPLMEHHISRKERSYTEIEPTRTSRGKGPHKVLVKNVVRALEKASPLKGRLALKFLTQAHAYVSIPAIRSTIDDVVRQCFTGEAIIISHSLGTVVAYNLLSEIARTDGSDFHVPLLITMGSPLSLRAIQRHIGAHPKPLTMVKKWVNVADEEDFIALGNDLNSSYFGMSIENHLDVDNGYDDPHSLNDYISSTPVSKALLETL